MNSFSCSFYTLQLKLSLYRNALDARVSRGDKQAAPLRAPPSSSLQRTDSATQLAAACTPRARYLVSPASACTVALAVTVVTVDGVRVTYIEICNIFYSSCELSGELRVRRTAGITYSLSSTYIHSGLQHAYGCTAVVHTVCVKRTRTVSVTWRPGQQAPTSIVPQSPHSYAARGSTREPGPTSAERLRGSGR